MESGSLGDAEAQELHAIRKAYAVPVRVFASSTVSADYYQAALRGVETTLRAVGQRRKVLSLREPAPEAGPFPSAEDYLSLAYARQGLDRDVGFGPQCVVEELLEHCYRDPGQARPGGPYLSVLVLDCDLTSRKSNGTFFNFAYGATHPDVGTVRSLVRLRVVKDPALRLRMFERVIEHETGHLLGLNQRSFHVEQRLGNHCSNVCVMRQGLDIQELSRHTQEEQQANVHFCTDCLAELAALRQRYKPISQRAGR